MAWIIEFSIAGYATCVFTVFLYAAGTGFAQALQGQLPDMELNFARFLVAVIVGTAIILITRMKPVFPRALIPWVAVKGVTKFVSKYCLYAGAPLLPVATMHAVNTTVIVVLCSVYSCVRKQGHTMINVCFAVTTFVGLMMALQPPIFNLDNHAADHNNNNHNNASFSNSNNNSTVFTVAQGEKSWVGIYLLYPFFAGVFSSGGIVISTLILKDIHPFIQGFYTNGVGFLLSVILMWVMESPRLPVDDEGWWMFQGHAWTSGLAACTLIYATMRIPPQALAIISSTDIVVLGTMQYTILSRYHPGHRNAVEIVGMVIILLSGVLQPVISYFQQKRKHLNEEERKLCGEN